MAEKSKFSIILQKNKVELAELQKKSISWFESQRTKLSSVYNMRSETLMRGDQKNKFTYIIPGNMYMYIYDPKYKKTLPYYDMFPLVFPFKQEKDGFMGLNLHYLGYKERAFLFEQLMTLRNNKGFDEKTRLKMSWGLLSTASKFAGVTPCVKHYLYDHVRPPFKLIEPHDWTTAMLLPLERFVKATPYEVWRDSKNLIRNNLLRKP